MMSFVFINNFEHIKFFWSAVLLLPFNKYVPTGILFTLVRKYWDFSLEIKNWQKSISPN